MNLAAAIEYQARSRPHAAALLFGQKVLRYRQLDQALWGIASQLAAKGVARGDVAGITMPNSALHLMTLLALARLGAVSVAVHPMLPAPAKRAVVKQFNVASIVSNTPDAGVDGIPLIVVDPSWMSRPARPDAAARHGAQDGDAPWRIVLSSGTTGAPKGVLQTHARTLNLVLLQHTVVSIAPGARYLVAMDLNATANLMRILRHLMAGSAIVFPRTLREMDDILDTINRQAVTHTLVSPDIAGRWVAAASGGRRAHMPGLAHLAIGGGRVSTTLHRDVVERLTPNVYVNYGTTETGLAAIADPDTYQRHPESVGHVVPWIQAEVVDEQDRPVAAGAPGIVRFRGIALASGYHGNAAATAKTFRNGWIYPGDTGRLSPDGILAIEARLDDIINVGGAKIDPLEIEEALAQHPEVVEAAAFVARSTSNQEGLCAAVVTRGPTEVKDLLQHCKDRLLYPPRKIFIVSELPRNQSGKVVRHELARRALLDERAGRGAAQ